ncbi:MAG TPA: hypothetical protein PKH65_02210 [Bacteroidia bacterium]|nr:hypothetical protein [Bacteroidia bacterium]HNT79469.1 hypothetical protein [Bacteroidia bacterium]
MQHIEPYYNWRDLYISEEDDRSPFYGRIYSEFEYSNTIYNFYIHPQWDDFDSPTLYLKIIFADYETEFAIIELIGEWNDCINNDIMLLKRDIIDQLIDNGINKFLLIGENVLNFHGSDDSYYQEWYDDVDEGWLCAMNFRPHVLSEFNNFNIDSYFIYGGELDEFPWRTYEPNHLMDKIESVISRRLMI